MMHTRTSVAPCSLPRPAEMTGEDILSVLKSTYDLVPDDVRVHGRLFSLYRIRDTNALIDSLAAEDLFDADRFPYWAQLWNSSIALAEWCLASGDVAGCTVLELGSGLGLAGIAACAAGATVTLTDFHPDALLCAQLNILRNLSEEERSRINVLHRDWRSTEASARHDIIIGADILYEHAMARPLLDLFHAGSAPGGRIVLADPDRATGEAFFALARREGFQVTTESHPVTKHGNLSHITLATLRNAVDE